MTPAHLPAKWLTFLSPWRQGNLAAQAGGQLARQCQADVWRRVGRQLDGMSIAEVRGYVRAVAAEYAAEEVDRILDPRNFSPRLREKVLASGIDQIVHRTICDVLGELPQVDARPLAA
jgi:hypothetical protein